MKILNLLLLSSICFAGGAIEQPQTPEEQSTSKNDKVFMFLAGGGSILNVDSVLQSGTQFEDGSLDDKGATVEIGAGYRVDENVFMTLGLQKTFLDIVDIDNMYISVNYQFPEISFKPYIGVLVGYSGLKWSKRPQPMYVSEDLSSNSFIYGAQAGMEIPLDEQWSFMLKYQYIKYDHFMDIRSGSSTISHDQSQNILTGVRYGF